MADVKALDAEKAHEKTLQHAEDSLCSAIKDVDEDVRPRNPIVRCVRAVACKAAAPRLSQRSP